MAYEEEDKVNFTVPVSRKWIGRGILGIILIIILVSIFYTVGPEQVGVIKRWGRFARTTEPGLHIKIPFAETVTKVRVRYIFKEEFGFRTLRAGERTLYAPEEFTDESLMLTGDLNAGVVEWVVQYKVEDPVDFLFNVRDVRGTVRAISEAVMRRVVGDRSIDEVLTVGRREVGEKSQEEFQRILDSYGIGIKVVTVKLKDVNPPDPVKPSFNEVNEAKQDKETTINQAWQAYNEAIPKAEGEAEKTISVAEGYAINRVNRARGEANKFVAVWKEYQAAKDVTKRRLYLETLGEILPKIGRTYILDVEQKGVLPLLSLVEEGGKQ